MSYKNIILIAQEGGGFKLPVGAAEVSLRIKEIAEAKGASDTLVVVLPNMKLAMLHSSSRFAATTTRNRF